MNLHLIHDQQSYALQRSELAEFYAVYLEAFPDEDEREDWDDIVARVCDPKATPRTFIFLDTQYPTAAGIIADYYPHIGVVHLIYIAVKPDHRGQGIAKRLIKELLPKAMSQLQSIYGFEVQAQLFESNIPWRTQKDAIDPHLRLQIFEHLGAKAIPIAYTQPALSEGKKNVENLFLLSFPFAQQTHGP